MDLNSVDIVGPASAIATLIDLSNVAATTRLTVTQIETLRYAFGMDCKILRMNVSPKQDFVKVLSYCSNGIVRKCGTHNISRQYRVSVIIKKIWQVTCCA